MKRIFKKITAILLSVLVLPIFLTKVLAEDNEKQIGERELEAIERIMQGFEGFAESIDISDLNIERGAMPSIFATATKNTPYLFYVDKKLTYTYRTGGGVIKVIPKYNMSKSEAERAIDLCKAEVKKMADLAMAGESELQRLLLAHDLICYRYKYDLSLENNNVYKFIKEEKGTCQGYTWTYMAVLRQMGIECEYVASDTIEHIWLRVKIDGEWYNSDVTWDDPVWNENSGAPISRRHVLFSDKKADKDGYLDRYGASLNKCTSEKYDNTDLSSELFPNHALGDIDHDGATTLFDLVKFLRDEILCSICADYDGDLILTEKDAELLREHLLTNEYE